MIELRPHLELEVSKLQEKLKANSDYLVSITQAIEKLSADRVTVINTLNQLSGSLSAYNEMLSKVKKETDRGETPHEAS
jgi:hypothetical protein